MSATAISSEAQRQLLNNGVLVLEGVAGIGKSYSIAEVRSLLTLTTPTPPSAAEVLARIIELAGALRSPLDVNKQPTVLPDWAGDDYVWLTRDTLRPPWAVQVLQCVMHPSTTYEEFIGGLRPDGPGRFSWKQGQFVRFLKKAQLAHTRGDSTRFLVVLDEINRCNLPSVLGELMYLIEPSRRITTPGVTGSQLAKDCKSVNVHPASSKRRWLWIPNNLFILGTMNSSDRSILGFDQALRRRFPPHRLEPFTVNHFDTYCKDNGGAWPTYAAAKANSATTALDAFCLAVHQYAALNCLLRFLIGPDAMIGHSYLLQALANAGFPNTATLNKFDGITQAEVELSIAAAWQFGMLPQLIHAAEAARQERVVEALTADITKAPTWLCEQYLPQSPDDDTFEDTVARLKEAIQAVGLQTAIDCDDLIGKEEDAAKKASRPPHYRAVLTLVLDTLFTFLGMGAGRRSRLRITGHAHGARLCISVS